MSFNKIYVLTADDYEDEHIVGVFSSKEKINKFKEKFPEEPYNTPYEFTIDGAFEQYYHPGNKNIYFIRINRDTGVYIKNVLEVSLVPLTISNVSQIGHIREDVFGNLYTYIATKDKDEAIEVGNIIRQRMYDDWKAHTIEQGDQLYGVIFGTILEKYNLK